ncbi:chemotaxis protein CheW [Pelosinus sp. sgz500959]|uniref:chemotaxis protein CheW n=1 Tax=Pelosinus sp. sgz500959 TaxID=3242472 RepID=UPI00367057E5
MRYGFPIQELGKIKIFSVEAIDSLAKIAGEILELRITLTIAQSRLIIDGIMNQLHILKKQAAFFGLMEMLMLIRQTQYMLEAMRSGNLQGDPGAVEILLDAKNVLEEMIREFGEASIKHQGAKGLEIELACAQDTEWLITFIEQLLLKKNNAALILVPQALVSKLPAIIYTPLIKLEILENSTENHQEDKETESLSIVNDDSIEIFNSKSTTVSDEKIEKLLTIIRELGNKDHAFHQMSRKLTIEYNLPNLSRETKAIGQFINRIAAELEEAVMSMRRVELGLIFLQFPQMIRDIELQTGKNIGLTMEGEHVTVDKTIVKELYNLLLKIICNMANFNIEVPAERKAAGKEIQGHICLTAYSSGNRIVIEVENDGRSMRGGEADAEVLEISDLMLSINEVYYQMDALPANLEMINLPDKGSKIRITLPPFSMRCNGLLVETSGELLAVPLDNVVEIIRVTCKQLITRRGRQLLYHRGEVLGIISLATILGKIEQQDNGSVTVLIVANGQNKIGLIVHKLHNEQEIVCKSLPDYLNHSEYIGGAAVTCDGKVALLLNISAMIKKMNSQLLS